MRDADRLVLRPLERMVKQVGSPAQPVRTTACSTVMAVLYCLPSVCVVVVVCVCGGGGVWGCCMHGSRGGAVVR